MKQPVSEGEPLNRRPPRLETDQDLLRDQLNYFRESNQLPHLSESLQDIHQQDDRYFSLLSRPTPQETPTTLCVEPIKERVVSRSSRRRPRSRTSSARANPFPQSTLITDDVSNHFARKSQPTKLQQTVTHQNSDPSILEEARARVEAMSIEQIRAAQQEIYDTLKPQSIQILTKMWLRRGQPSPSPQNTLPPTERVKPIKSTSVPENPPTGIEHAPPSLSRAESGPSKVRHPLSTEAHAENNAPTKVDESDEEETNKRLWMTDAEEPAPSQEEVDELIETALETLGDISRWRFGLHGTVLSSEEIQTLPTHLGLHHHGSSPASAGYTLSDILVLMRSTVVSQRVIAMQMLKSIVLHHGDNVLSPLTETGTLTLVFSHLPVDKSFYAAFTNQVAYLELVEILAKDEPMEIYDFVNNLYFGSNFYSPCHVQTHGSVAKALADSDVIVTLIGIARASAMRLEHIPVAERALRLVRMFVARVPDAAQRVQEKRASLLALKTLTTISAESHPLLFMLSCHVVSHVVVSLGWKGDQILEQIQQDVIDNRFLHIVSSKMLWLLDSDIAEITAEQSLVAKGVLRLIRAALTFQMGIEPFAALAHVVCRLVRQESTTVEAYLALEAYSHALFVQASSRQNEDMQKTSNGTVRKDEQQGQTEDEHISCRLSALIPNAISAAAVFVDSNVHSKETRAAAGHFAATLFTLTSHLMNEDFVLRTINVSSRNTDELDHLVAISSKSIEKIQTVASLSHAAARLLAKVKLEEGFVLREVKVLMAASSVEKAAKDHPSTISTAHVVANACAEWIGVYSRIGPSRTTAELALRLLPWLTDVRVTVDLLSRTLLNARVLQGLDPTFMAVTAEKCAHDLLPMTITELSALQQSRTEDENNSLSMSFEDLCNLWITEDKVYDSLFRVLSAFFESKLLRDTALFECLLQTPVIRYSNSVFKFMLEVGQSCVYQDRPLIAGLRKTTVSGLSTTVNPRITDSVLSLCDFLLSREPASPKSADNENPDFLASILLTLMCGFDIDNTLRVLMWKRTVDDCGGATLYQDAVALKDERSLAKTSLRPELDDMLRLFGVSISEGYLDGERCPSVLKNAILTRIEAALSSGRSANDVFEVLASSVRSRSSLSQRLMKLKSASTATSIEPDNLLSGFLGQVKSFS